MRALVQPRFGDPAEVLSVQEVPDPQPGPGEVLVRVRREGGAFVGEYGQGLSFRVEDMGEDALIALARRMLRDLAAVYAGTAGPVDGALN